MIYYAIICLICLLIFIKGQFEWDGDMTWGQFLGLFVLSIVPVLNVIAGVIAFTQLKFWSKDIYRDGSK